MQYFTFLTYLLLLFIKTNSTLISEDAQIEKSNNRTLTWKLEVNQSFVDGNKIDRTIQLLSRDRWADDEASMNDIERSSRLVRSIKSKWKRKKIMCVRKKGKRNRKRGRKPVVQRRINIPPQPSVTQTTTVTFPPGNVNIIVDFIKNSKAQNQLENFSKISDMINNCTGLLSNDHISILQELAVSYAHTTRAIKVSFADTCAILSKFVVKAYHVMKHSMNKKDEETLQNFEKTLKIDILNRFNSFENSSRNQLIEIHSKLLIKAHGAKMKALLKQRTEEETKVETKAEELKKKYVELSIIQTNIESLRYNQSILEKAMNDSEKAKKYIEVEIQRLENQISSYEQKLLDHRNTRTKEYRKSWIYSWKVRDVIKNNGESIARENLYRLLDRIRTMKHTMKYWSNENVVKRLTIIKYNLTRLLNDSNSQEKLYKKYNESYNQAETKFFKVIKEIESIEETTGTVNVKSMEAIDRLARAVQSGQESFVDAYSAVRRIIGSLDLNPDLLTQSILYALKFLRMGDDYMKTTRIDDIRRLLGIV